ncbi:hypothetical protein D9619_010822 [Psilocybe cf. subviscida]|uniref:Methyltransferase domain-containing protein n=1 Tax=Psilocybe cf. subviscida TaxID=2480587 RepID=A0A8H5BAU1_9AGAR|nr:hypothetical protein D9619_010822 [Psilocybe cf. subviscida]
MPTVEEISTSDIGAEGHAPPSKSYLLPYNDVEIQRLLVQQKNMSEIYEGRIVIAPVNLKEGSEVLDVATGSGVWALDLAERYPNADTTKITCIDIGASMFPKEYPSNMTFQVASALAMPAGWTNKFALVHQRLILSGIKYDEWEQDIREIYRVTEPGGWAQLCEWNNGTYDHEAAGTNYKPGPAETKVMDLAMRVGEKNGMDLLCAKRIAGLMAVAGFVEVRKEERAVPLGAWNGDLSRSLAENLATVFRGYKDAVLKAGGFGVIQRGEDYDALVDEVEREWASGPGGYDSFVVFVGKKLQ